ncbi:hypothetical protein [Asticcacaulis solisilvae]|uniref:hypothetical protein n=1 Tax=Asticcacaulis solisilvae TaxID=1217274 RepID=UPI003FD6C588
MKVSRVLLCVSACAALGACKPSQSALDAATKVQWQVEIGGLQSEAAFMDEHAKGFDDSVRLVKEVSASVGQSDNGEAERSAEIARQDREQAAYDRYLAKGVYTAMKSSSCAEAKPKPGNNCDVVFAVKTADGKSHELTGHYRFDKVDGKLAVVEVNHNN